MLTGFVKYVQLSGDNIVTYASDSERAGSADLPTLMNALAKTEKSSRNRRTINSTFLFKSDKHLYPFNAIPYVVKRVLVKIF